MILPLAAFAKLDEAEPVFFEKSKYQVAVPVWPEDTKGSIEIVVGDNYRIEEQKMLTFDINAITTTNVEPVYSAISLPAGASLEGNTFYWQPDCSVVEFT